MNTAISDLKNRVADDAAGKKVKHTTMLPTQAASDNRVFPSRVVRDAVAAQVPPPYGTCPIMVAAFNLADAIAGYSPQLMADREQAAVANRAERQ